MCCPDHSVAHSLISTCLLAATCVLAARRCSGNQEHSAEFDKDSGLQSESKRASHEELNSSDAREMP